MKTLKNKCTFWSNYNENGQRLEINDFDISDYKITGFNITFVQNGQWNNPNAIRGSSGFIKYVGEKRLHVSLMLFPIRIFWSTIHNRRANPFGKISEDYKKYQYHIDIQINNQFEGPFGPENKVGSYTLGSGLLQSYYYHIGEKGKPVEFRTKDKIINLDGAEFAKIIYDKNLKITGFKISFISADETWDSAKRETHYYPYQLGQNSMPFLKKLNR